MMQLTQEKPPICSQSEQSGCRHAATRLERTETGRMTLANARVSQGRCGFADPAQGRIHKHNKELLSKRQAVKKIEPSLAYMVEHLREPLDVSLLASLCGLAPAQFFTLFKRATSRTPIDFFIHARMCRARELLKDPTLDIKTVAALVGYHDRFYFSRIFKSVNGMAPSEYRFRQAGLAADDSPFNVTRSPQTPWISTTSAGRALIGNKNI
jgi:AraC-like DNA-binding protein